MAFWLILDMILVDSVIVWSGTLNFGKGDGNPVGMKSGKWLGRADNWEARLGLEIELLKWADTGLTQCGYWSAAELWLCIVTDNEEHRKKIVVKILPVGQNRMDSTDNVTDIRNVVQSLRLSPTLQVSARAVC